MSYLPGIDKYNGLDKKNAVWAAQRDGHEYIEIASEDGISTIRTIEYNNKRLNLNLVNGLVISAFIG